MKVQAVYLNLIIIVKEEIEMFLFWLFVAIAFGIAEEIHDSIDAYNYHKSGGFYAKYPCFKPKDYTNKK